MKTLRKGERLFLPRSAAHSSDLYRMPMLLERCGLLTTPTPSRMAVARAHCSARCAAQSTCSDVSAIMAKSTSRYSNWSMTSRRTCLAATQRPERGNSVFGVWQSCGHFSRSASIPNFKSRSIESVEWAAREKNWTGVVSALIGELKGGEWTPRYFVEVEEMRPLTPRQIRTYSNVRSGRWSWTNSKPLPDWSELATATIDLDLRRE